MHLNPYAISRQAVYSSGGMVATSHPLAAEAGLAVLRDGGNAVDAAIASATTLTVVEPTQNGIGGDAFALVWDGRALHGLNGSGRAPTMLTRDWLGVQEGGSLPERGWKSVTVPGAPRAWADLHARFGSLAFEKLLQPAIRYARHGAPLAPVVAEYWRRMSKVMAGLQGDQYDGWHDTFMPDGFEPRAGMLWRSEAMAKTLEMIAQSGADDFYTGALAMSIDRFSRHTGGALRAEDLAAHASDWVEPIQASYQGHQVWELPPNTQAIATLMALNILNGLDRPVNRDDEYGLHLQIEAMKLAFADVSAYVGDYDHSIRTTEQLLAARYAAQRRALISETACDPQAGMSGKGDTVYLATADRSGMMVSFIQSNYMWFGSGVVVPDTGIALQNRGHSFNLIAGSPNELKPGKRPYHTIMPGFLTRDGAAVGPFGVMGGFMQPQGHLQVILNTLDHRMNPQTALDAPRWNWLQGKQVRVEQSMPSHVVRGLMARGHEISIGADDTGFGRGQIIWRDSDGVLVGGSDCRADGQVAAF